MKRTEESAALFRNIKAVAVDLDGTIYFGEKVADRAVETTTYLVQRGLKVVYFTNNSVNSKEQILTRLSRMGFKLRLDDVYTSGNACAIYAKSRGLRNVFCVGSPGLKEELNNQGIFSVDENNVAEALIIGLDKQFNYQKLAYSSKIWRSGIEAIACNLDRAYPIENGEIMPGCGAIVAAIECTVGKKVDVVVGKPNTFMIEMLASNLNLAAESILVVGDSLESDIKMARKFGSPSVLVGSPILSDDIPTISIRALSELKVIIDLQGG